jgi:hypothetical protein
MCLTNNRCSAQVLEHVRLPLLSPYFLHDCVESQAVVRQSSECRHLVEEAKMFHLLPDRRAELQSLRTKHRNSAGTLQVCENQIFNIFL